MNKRVFIAALVLTMMSGLVAYARATKVWSDAAQYDVARAKAGFANPPSEFASHVIWGWEGPMNLETICHDLDSIKTKGFRSVIFEAGYRLPYEYLSQDWFLAIRSAVEQAAKRGLKVWIIDEGKYPSGFAGGKFSKLRPDLRMQAVVSVDTIFVGKGSILNEYPVDSRALSAIAVPSDGSVGRPVEIKDHKISFNAGMKDYSIILAGADFRTGQTRAVNNPNGGKDTSNSLCDYLNPLAVRQFIDWTHEQYKKYIGEYFGTTVLGFRGDEPDFAYIPWTPSIVEEFAAIKGYDPTKYLASLLVGIRDEDQKRFRADYWDVWSELFAKNFFEQQAVWCEENGLAYITHLNNEHNMPVCVRAEGSLFRTLSRVQVPGVDAIWNQIWPGVDNDFPKYASSVSHVWGKQRAFSESFAAYYTAPDIDQAKFVVDHQLARGINFFEFMFWMAGSKTPNWMSDPGMKSLNDYTARATYLMSVGKPGARIAVYFPTMSYWKGSNAVNDDLLKISKELLSHQKDFDWVDEDAFDSALRVGSGYLENKSGQRYYTLIIPSCELIPEKMWAKIEEFAMRGGKLLFWGRRPYELVSGSFFKASGISTPQKALYEGNAVWSPVVEAAMPSCEISTSAPQSGLRYQRRVLSDGCFYFLFNEGDTPLSCTASFDEVGKLSRWDCRSGEIIPVEGKRQDDRTLLELTLEPWESLILCFERGKTEFNVRKLGVKSSSKLEQTAAIQAVIDKAAEQGGGTVVFPRGTYLSGALFFPRGVSLRVEKGALLKAVVAPNLFPAVSTRFEGIERDWRCAFLNFDNNDKVCVSGEGTIDGSGLEWSKQSFAPIGRPRLICFTNCDSGSISSLKLRNQASWCVHVLYTEGFRIENLDIEAREYIPSSDGVDIDSCCDVYIGGTRFYVHDDCISIKSGKDEDGRRVARPSEDILIENCHFEYGHGGITMGSEISGSIRNVVSRNCLIENGNWAPIRFKSQPSRGGIVENISFEDIRIDNALKIIEVNFNWRPGSQRNMPVEYSDPVTVLRNVSLKNCSGNAKSLGEVQGFDIAPFEKGTFHFENCRFETESGLRIKNAAEDDFSTLGQQF